MKTLQAFIKSEIVLIVSFLLALLSACFVTPGKAYLETIDFRTLALLFCFMLIMEGWKRLGLFQLVAEKLLQTVHTTRGLSLVFPLLCFFSSMLITNDVALITFVPFTVLTLRLTGEERLLIPIVVLETVAANLGSMLTPIGNPQNLYLFSAFHMEIGVFFQTIYPYAVLSLVLVTISALFMGKRKVTFQSNTEKESVSVKRCMVYGVLMALALLTVFRVLPYLLVLLVCVVVVWVVDKGVFRHVDYSLLFTFVFLFIFIGNLSRIPWVSNSLCQVLTGREVPVAILTSQVFSNVPAAILLSGFTEQTEALLIGTNLGGLGTLIASMASLISFKILARERVNTGKYLLYFTGVNLLFLAVLVVLFNIL